MPAFKHSLMVEWGDCDALGIVFYPAYFRWMDATFHRLTKAAGFDRKTLEARDGVAGCPLVDARCSFVSPVRFYDELDILATVEKLGGSSMTLNYRFERDGKHIAEGVETHVFVRETANGLGKAPIPDDIRQALEAFMND